MGLNTWATHIHQQPGFNPEGGRWGSVRAVEEVDWPKPGPFPIRATQNERYFPSRPGLKLGHFDPAGMEDIPGHIERGLRRFYSSREQVGGDASQNALAPAVARLPDLRRRRLLEGGREGEGWLS